MMKSGFLLFVTATLVGTVVSPLVANALSFSSVPRSGASRSLKSIATSRLWKSPVHVRQTSRTASTSSRSEGDGQWMKPAVHNSGLFRSAAVLTALAVAGYSPNAPLAKLSAAMAATIHILAFATWCGSVAYTTFVVGITMFKNLPRKTFGRLQSKLFPIYFNLSAVAIALQLITIKKIPPLLNQKVKVTLSISLVATLLNLFVLEPKATSTMYKRYHQEEIPGWEDNEDYKKLASRFGKLHGMSSLANLVALCGSVAHGVYISSVLAP